MKISQLPKEEDGFQLLPCNFCGQNAVLVTPQKSKEGLNLKWNKHNVIFRSSIWSYPNLELLSASYPKFFNYFEKPDLYPNPEKYKDWLIEEKKDGCCDGNTLIKTQDGEKTIQEICETHYRGKILAFDFYLQRECYTNILGTSIKNNNNDWYEIEFDDGTIIKLTGCHRIWIDNLKAWRRVDELDGTETFLKNSI